MESSDKQVELMHHKLGPFKYSPILDPVNFTSTPIPHSLLMYNEIYYGIYVGQLNSNNQPHGAGVFINNET